MTNIARSFGVDWVNSVGLILLFLGAAWLEVRAVREGSIRYAVTGLVIGLLALWLGFTT